RFLFAGFPPNTASARRKWLREVAQVPATLIFYESPKRVSEMLADCVTEFGEDRQAVVCRELTKRFEEVRRGTLSELAAEFSGQSVKGEIVVLVDRVRGRQFGPEDVDAALRERLGRMSVKDAAAEVAEALGMPRREVYQAALALEEDE
ncbi:MAG: SAM-dependent methyltransferase, partial [Paracoccaceae bacterium]|nr:SAM-dependent methyltransferase [Paracoccaceae bacterium]